MARDLSTCQSAVKRRQLLAGIGTAASAGLAGCGFGGGDDGGDGDGDDGMADGGDGGDDGSGNGSSDEVELGERVPTLTFRWWTGLGGVSRVQEQAAPIVHESIVESLGLDIELSATDAITSFVDMINDQRNAELVFTHHGNAPNRLDPDEQIRRTAVDFAGEGAGPNPQNYANCEYSELAVAQSQAETTDERREIVNEALSIISNEIAAGYPMYPTPVVGAYRTDEVTLNGVGQAGIDPTNPIVFIKSEHQRGDPITVNVQPDAVRTLNWLTMTNIDQLPIWAELAHSPLVSYDENYELRNILARNIEVTDSAQTFTVELRDATFHNGDPITAEDVKFTIETVQANVGVYPQPHELPYDTIEAIDEKTVEVTTTQPMLPLTSNEWTRWGILHKESWQAAGIEDPPEDRDVAFDEFVGSGPFQIENFRQDESLHLTPHPGHPLYSPANDLIMVAMSDVSTVLESFRANELQMAYQIGPSIADEIEQTMDNAEVVFGQGHQVNVVYPQFPIAPTKFQEFRDAVGKSINRQEVVDVAVRGRAEPDTYCMFWSQVHPWRPSGEMLHQFTDDPTGDPEAARQVLEEAGWGWDDDGQLRYPADADLSPLWPQGETPSPDDFPCLDSL